MRLAFVLTLPLIAGACASADQPDTVVGMRGVDESKMQAIEEAAERTGAKVYWVNPPVKPSAPTQK